MPSGLEGCWLFCNLVGSSGKRHKIGIGSRRLSSLHLVSTTLLDIRDMVKGQAASGNRRMGTPRHRCDSGCTCLRAVISCTKIVCRPTLTLLEFGTRTKFSEIILKMRSASNTSVRSARALATCLSRLNLVNISSAHRRPGMSMGTRLRYWK